MDAYSSMSEIDSLCDLPRMIRNKNRKRDVYNVCHVSRWLSRSCLWEHHKCQRPGHERTQYKKFCIATACELRTIENVERQTTTHKKRRF